MTKRKINLMKTRKYKDNQQRKNFSKNEANLLLKQYFKKLASVAGRSTNKVSELKLVYLNPAMPRITRSHSLGSPPRLCRH